jgi:hypothetical protein
MIIDGLTIAGVIFVIAMIFAMRKLCNKRNCA